MSVFVYREIQRFPYVLFWYFAKFKASSLRRQTVSQSAYGNSYYKLIPNPTLVDHVYIISIEG